MTAMKTLSAILPEPKYHDERISSKDDSPSTDTRLVVKVSGPPPYGRRGGWIPRTLEDYGDGGAYPEINVAQYPLEMGNKKSVTLPFKVNVD